MSLELLWNVLEKKEEVKRLTTIKGITLLAALAFLADVGQQNGYIG